MFTGTENYNRAYALLEKGVAEKHHTFDVTGIITLNLGGAYCGYVDPNEKFVEITRNNSVVCYGNISDDLCHVEGSRHNREWDIVSW